MKILYTINSGNHGGSEQHILDLVEGMKLYGYDVYVWCCEGPMAEKYRQAGASVSIRPVKVTFGLDIDPSYISELVRFLREEKIDIIHAHELRAVGNSLLAGFIAGTKVRVSQIHTPFSQWQVSKKKRALYIFCYNIAVRLFSTVEVAVSNTSLKAKINEGLPKHKLAQTLNTVDFSRFYISKYEKESFSKEIRSRYGIPQDALVIGNMSRTTKEKGHDILIRAFSEILKKQTSPDGKELRLLIAGGGVLESELRALIKELGLEGKAFVTGVFQEEDKLKLYASMDYFVFPSLAEGFGIVVLEAMASGVPVLCSNLPVLVEVGKEFAWYFETANFNDLADKLSELIAVDEGNARAWVDEAFRYAEDTYGKKTFWDTYDALYRKYLK